MTAPQPIVEQRPLDCSGDRAFRLFTVDLGLWWPKAYSWSQDALERIWIEPQLGGRALERAHGEETVWGFVTAFAPGERLGFRWMIDPDRSAQPDPARASLVDVVWTHEAGELLATITHSEFERHPGDSAGYRAGLASPQGWPYLMDLYATACAG